MSFMVVSNKEEIRALLPRLKAASEPGRSNDGTRVLVNYKAFGEPAARARWESQIARDEGWDLRQYSGTLDRVFHNARGELCFTILCLERTNGDGRHHTYRSFNTVRGDIRQLVVLGANGSRHNGNGEPPKPS